MHTDSYLPQRAPRATQFNPLASLYGHVFEEVVADTPALREECFRIRYQVYCVEQGFEDPARNPGELERDCYDDHAAHALLLHRGSGAAIGTIRLILHKSNRRTGSLPFHKICPDPRARDAGFLPLDTTAEVSRLAISKIWRRRLVQDAILGTGEPTDVISAHRRLQPCLALGLMKMAVQFGVAHGIHHFCAVMEPSLLRMLSRCGIHFKPFGPLVQYHGRRQPCYAELVGLLDGIEAQRPDIWDIITDYGRLRARAAVAGLTQGLFDREQRAAVA